MSKQYGFQKKCDKCGYFMLFSRCFNCESADYFQKTDKKLSEKKKMPKWGYIGIVLFIMLIVAYNINSSPNVSLCDCLTDAEYGNANEEKCNELINSELGFNWMTTNFSQEPEKSAKFDALAAKCN